MNKKDQVTIELIHHLLEDIRQEQKKVGKELVTHAKEDAIWAAELNAHLTEIKVHIATIDQKVKQHTSNFNKVWAIMIPVIVTILTYATIGGVDI